MPFKPFYGSCPLCPKDKTVLIVARSGFCKFHQWKNKNKGKKPKPKKIRVFKPKKATPIKKVKFGICIECDPEKTQLLATKHLCHYHNEQKKKIAKSNKIVKLVDRAEKQKSVKYLIKKLDEIFSLFIRLRDSDRDGYGRCVTCPTIKHFRKMDCGHYITRGEKSIRWNEFNTALQCKPCNGFGGGEQVLFKDAINKRWGMNTAENLEVKRHFSKKLDRFELEFLINEYTERVNILMSKKSFTI